MSSLRAFVRCEARVRHHVVNDDGAARQQPLDPLCSYEPVSAKERGGIAGSAPDGLYYGVDAIGQVAHAGREVTNQASARLPLSPGAALPASPNARDCAPY